MNYSVCNQKTHNYVEKFYFLISAMIINMDRRMKHMEYEITDLQQLSKGRELLLKKECVRIDFGNSD